MSARHESCTVLLSCLAVLVLAGPSIIVERAEAETDLREELYHRYLRLGRMIAGGYVEPCWGEDGSEFWYEADGKSWRVEVKRNTVVREQDAGYSKCRDARSQAAQVNDKARKVRRARWLFDMKEIRSPNERWFAHLKDHDLWLREVGSDRFVRLTDDGNTNHYWGDDEQPWSWWSPGSSILAIKKIDERGVPRITLPGVGESPQRELRSFPAVGNALPRPHLYLIDVQSGEVRHVELEGDPEKWLSVLGWRGDGSELVVMTIDRPHKKMRLLGVDPNTTQVRQILVESRSTFYEPPWARRPIYIPVANGKEFIWSSEKDGWYRLYRYSYSGQQLGILTPKGHPVHDVTAVDESSGWLYFQAHGDAFRPYDIHVYRTRLDGSKLQKLTEGPGIHTATLSPSMTLFLDQHSSISIPPRTDLLTTEGEILATLEVADVSVLGENDRNRPEEFVVKAADDETLLYGVLYKPQYIDPNERYPVVEYIYDGPQTTLVPRRYGPRDGMGSENFFPLDNVDPRALAQLGFIVLVVDGRGTPERGKRFHDVLYRRPPDDVIAEHVAVLEQVSRERPYMDLDRVGIFGVSDGGYKATRAVLMAPDKYHAAVAISAPSDLHNLLAGGIEPYRGLIEDYPDEYENASNIPLAAKLTGSLLIIHGEDDEIVPVDHAIRMATALENSEREFSVRIIPGQGHLFEGDGASVARQAMRSFFIETLRDSGP